MTVLVGTPVGRVTIGIHYEIIEHFSSHLYSSPNKAVEELVVNGFDALAVNVRVWLPGKHAIDSLIVWDDGESMDIKGLQGLWSIARSPKANEGARERTVQGRERKVIGKFGIGKLASYTVGRRITHVCKTGNRFLAVDIDYDEVTDKLPRQSQPGTVGSDVEVAEELPPQLAIENRSEEHEVTQGVLPRVEVESYDDGEVADESQPPAPAEGSGDHGAPFAQSIVELSEASARAYLAGLFETQPGSFDEMFKSTTWTVAVVSDMKVDLKPGRLIWVLGNGMPLRPDFRVFVDELEVEPKYARKDPEAEWEIGDAQTTESLKTQWKEDTKLQFGERVGLDPENPDRRVPFVAFPTIGHVWGNVRLYEQSLIGSRAEDQGRSHGFFILVRGRLINVNDPQVLLAEPSYGTFYRSQYVVHADGLDDALLANREEIRRDTDAAHELGALQSALYRLVRARKEELDEERVGDEEPRVRLPTRSREFYLDPMSTLFSREADDFDFTGFDIRSPLISVVAAGIDAPIVAFSTDGNGFAINSDHPYYSEIEGRLNADSKSGRRAMAEFRALVATEKLLEGYLYESGLSETEVKRAVRWRDNLLRELAAVQPRSFAELEQELLAASRAGSKAFERAIASLFQRMGFEARTDGASGAKDGIVVFPRMTTRTPWKLAVEAKGRKQEGGLPNDEAEVSGAAAHRDAAGANHAIIVTRKFAGFDADPLNENAAVLKECRTTKGVSIVELEALMELLRALDRFAYSLDNETIYEALTAVEPPAAKLDRIRTLSQPFAHFDYRWFLDRIWARQTELDGRPVSLLDLYYRAQKELLSFDLDEADYNARFQALQSLSPTLIRVHDDRVLLERSPTHIAQHIQALLDPRAESDG